MADQYHMRQHDATRDGSKLPVVAIGYFENGRAIRIWYFRGSVKRGKPATFSRRGYVYTITLTSRREVTYYGMYRMVARFIITATKGGVECELPDNDAWQYVHQAE